MDTKLTLLIDDKVIEQAKVYARTHHTSLSQIIENFLSSLTANSKNKPGEEISPLVKNLSGVVHLKEGYDYKSERAKHLQEKYR